MHIFVYEWVTGGGMVEHPLSSLGTLLEEGATMLRAVATDFTRLSHTRVSVFRDIRLAAHSVAGAEVIDIDSRAQHNEEFERLASSADAMLVIAPEFDGILADLVSRAEALSTCLVSPSCEFVRLAGHKHGTAERLRAAGLPVPLGRLLEPDEPLPSDFPYPAVLKPVDGCGSQDIYVVATPYESPPAYSWPRRLEQFIPGLAASVAVLCGSAGRFPLAPCRQLLSSDGRLRYVGGALPLTPGLADRARRLAVAALAALPPARGYVGVDLVLGSDPNGFEDVVIEVNPRVTTSYVGLRTIVRENLAEQMLRVAGGAAAELSFDVRPIEFDTLGAVNFAG